MAKKLMFHLTRFIGLLLVWIIILTMIKNVFHVTIDLNLEIAISILAVISSALLSYPLQIVREETIYVG